MLVFKRLGFAAFMLLAVGSAFASPLLSRAAWAIQYVDSEETAGENGAASNVLDGNPNTYWHSAYSAGVAPLPHELRIDLGSSFLVNELSYLGRQSAPNGRIAAYRAFVSQDGVHWGAPVARGLFVNTTAAQNVSFVPVVGRYFRLVADSEVNNGAITTIADLSLRGTSVIAGTGFAPESSIVSPVASTISIGPGGVVDFAGVGLDYDQNAPFQHLWTFGDGSGIPNSSLADPAPVRFLQAGTFTVTFTVIDSEGRVDPTPDSRVVTVGESIIPRRSWTIADVDSEETVGENGRATNAIDGNAATYWHTKWLGGVDPLSHGIVLDLGLNYTLTQLRYLPRQSASNGRIREYRLFVSQDGVHWGAPLAAGSFPSGAGENVVDFVPTSGRYFSMVADSEVSGGQVTTVAEINLKGFEVSPGTNQAPDSIILVPSEEISVGAGVAVDFEGLGLDLDHDQPFSYRWSFGDGSGIPDSMDVNPAPVVFAADGIYTVTFTVTDEQGLADPTPAQVTVLVGAAELPQSGWKLLSVDSQETVGENGAATNAFDGNPATHWHSKWKDGLDPIPHEIRIDLGANFVLNGFSQLPRQSAANGRISEFEFSVSQNGVDWGAPVAQGSFVTGSAEQLVSFPATVGRYIGLKAISELNGGLVTSLAEIKVRGYAAGSGTNHAPDSIIRAPVLEVFIAPGGGVNFAGVGTDIDNGQTLQYRWNFGQGSGISDSTAANPGLVTFGSVGQYTVTLTVTDDLGLADPTPDTVVVSVGGAKLQRDIWAIKAVSSEETSGENSPASNALDGNPATYWHSKWTGTPATGPHVFELDLGAVFNLTGFTYLGRQDASNGRFGNYAFFVSNDGLNYGTAVASGNLANTKAEQTVNFPQASARFVKLVSYADVNGSTIATMAELNVIGYLADPNANLAPNGVINAPVGDVSIPVGGSVSFVGTGTDLNASQQLAYLWNFGAGSGVANATVEDPGARQFNVPGVFTVTLTVTDDQGVADVTPDTRRVSVGVTPLNKATWTLVSSNSVETVSENGAAARAIDGNASTYWHSKYTGGLDPVPHEIVVDLGGNFLLNELSYLPRQSAPNGRLKNYRLTVSQDGVHWGGPAAAGAFANTTAEQKIPLIQSAGRFIRLRGYGDQNGSAVSAVAEIDVRGQPVSGAVNQAPDGVISSPANVESLLIGVGETVDFAGFASDLESSGPFTYSWSFGTGSGIPGSVMADPAPVRFNLPGTFPVTLTVADAAGAVDPTPHIIQVTVGAAELNRSLWTVASVSSQETLAENGAASRAFDNNPATFWHTKYQGGVDARPHVLDIRLGGQFTVSKLAYLARQDAANGRVAGYRLFVSQDGTNWGAPVVTGVFLNTPSEQTVEFPGTAGSHVRFVCDSDVFGGTVTTVAELRLFGQAVTGGLNQNPDGVILLPISDRNISRGETVTFAGLGLDIEDGSSLSYRWTFGAGSGVPESNVANPGALQFNQVGTHEVVLRVTDSQGAVDATPAKVTVVVTAGEDVLDPLGWSLVSVSSEETLAEDGSAANAFDGNPATYWHTKYSNGIDPYPHELVLDFGSLFAISGFNYVPRQNAPNGRVADYSLYFSRDGENWGPPVSEGTFRNSPSPVSIVLPGLAARYVRFVALNDVNGLPVATVGELGFSGSPAGVQGNSKPYGSIAHPEPNVDVLVDQGRTVTFTASAIDLDRDEPLSYSWRFGNNSGIPDSTAKNPPPVRFNLPGSYTVTLTVTDARGAVNEVSDSRKVIVAATGLPNDAPNGTIESPVRDLAVLPGTSLDFSGSGVDSDGNTPLVYSWSFGTGSGIANFTGSNPPPVQFNTAGIYTVTLTVSDSRGLADPTPDSLRVRVGSELTVPRENWKILAVDSQEIVAENSPVSNILDGLSTSFWHTRWSPSVDPMPHQVEIDLGATYTLSGLRYLPRQQNPNGRIGAYKVFVSADGVSWGSAVKQGTFVNSVLAQTATFTAKVGRYVRFVIDSEVNGASYATMAELDMLQIPTPPQPAPATVVSKVAEAAGYQLVYDLNVGATNDFRNEVPYAANHSVAYPNGSFDRIAYFMQLDSQWVWVSMNAFTSDAGRIGVPATLAHAQSRRVANLNVVSSSGITVTNGSGIASGNLEFWPTNFGRETVAVIPGGSSTTFDFNDTYATFGTYGSMQIHNYGAQQTLFGFNNWNTTAAPSDLGLGTAATGEPDWTLAANASSYTSRKLYVLVRPGTYVGGQNLTLQGFPRDGALVSRDMASNLATLAINGTEASGLFDAAILRVFRKGVKVGSDMVAPLVYTSGTAAFSFAPTIPAEFAEYSIELHLKTGPDISLVRRVDRLVAGDAFAIVGQSNADSAKYNGSAFLYENPFVRTFGLNTASAAGTIANQSWLPATGDGSFNQIGGIGQWGLVMGNRLATQLGIPVAILNAGHGGRAISFFQRDETDHDNVNTNYGRMLYRLSQAGLANSLRGMFFYQGESDEDDNEAAAHDEGLARLRAAWLEDYPSLERLFLFQVREGCGVARFDLGVRERERLFAGRYAGISLMSVTGLNGHDGCHFAFSGGYEILGTHVFNLVMRDLYGGASANVDPPNPVRAELISPTQIRITLANPTDSISFGNGAGVDFRIEGAAVNVTGASTAPGFITLNLSGDAPNATRLKYTCHAGAGPVVTNGSGVGLLTFDIPIQ